MIRPPVADPSDPDAGAPEWWRNARRLRRIPIVLAFLLAIIVIKGMGDAKPPPLTTSCATPAIALSTATQKQHHTVRWSVTGPAKSVFELTLGVSRVDVDPGGQFVFVPEEGGSQKTEQRAGHQQTMPKSCKTSGAFGVLVPPGHYTVRMFQLSGPVTSPTVSEVASAPLTVTPQH